MSIVIFAVADSCGERRPCMSHRRWSNQAIAGATVGALARDSPVFVGCFARLSTEFGARFR